MATQIDNADNSITFTAYCGPVRRPCVEMHFRDKAALRELREAYAALVEKYHTKHDADDVTRWQNIVLELDRRLKSV